jgi:hypothetical protein
MQSGDTFTSWFSLRTWGRPTLEAATMDSSSDAYYECTRCGNTVSPDDDFCPHCGDLFSENVFCINHSDLRASGVCIICAVPLCPACGSIVMGRFLCTHHSTYEIYEGMVRIYGALDDLAAHALYTRYMLQGGFRRPRRQ